MESILSVSLFVLRVLHHSVSPTAAQGSALPIATIYIRRNDPTRSMFLKREREGKVWNTVTVGVQGSRSERFGGRVHSKREFIGMANFFNLKCLVFFSFFFW